MTNLQAQQDAHIQAAVATRHGRPDVIVTRYALVAELMDGTGQKTLWRMSGPEDIYPWDVQGLLHSGLNGTFDDTPR